MKKEFLLILFICYVSFTKDHISYVEAHHVKDRSVEASVLAQKAAQEAKAAEDAQPQAGRKAAHQVEEELAEKACEAAHAAEAALEGKETLLDEIGDEIKESELVVNEETASLQQVQQAAQKGTKACQDSSAIAKLLQTAVQIAQQNCVDAQEALEGVRGQIAEKKQLIEAAKTRCKQLAKQYHDALDDLKKTQEAARKADKAAEEAKKCADRTRRRAHKRNTA